MLYLRLPASSLYLKMLKQSVVLIFLSLSFGLGDENCDSLGVLLYKDIGCEPVKVEGKTCPVSFNCPSFEHENGTCLFKGRTFKSGERIDDDVTYSSCRVLCTCDSGSLICASLDCPEHVGAQLPFGCNRTYTPGKCCSTGKRCAEVKMVDSRPTFEPIPDLAKCTVDGKDYLEGEKFSPSDSCSNCVCQKGFEGKFVEPFCTRQVCSEQLRDNDKLARNCAPAYFGDGQLCCPDAYVCHKDTDAIKQISAVKEDSELKCKFGKQDVKLGEGLETKIDHWGKDKDLTCECILPPFLTCTEKK